ncbi:thiopurine S-methyltransferase [Thiothrix caldifontis]|uniref:Thiopurine S-methyltransferase n=1 Tax=Thiothrix caldifontis TaxID=525918 RepID=A0A1H4B0H4_9GAMM|nr:thiopurine S-methyltransferase [Thiothrix caldifontis]SEA41548.1 thiopurine S-methyltransferase [Thiothrix caldifontis]
MQADFWLERWEYNQIGFHQPEINSHLQAFWGNLDVPKGSNIFVPLCGKSRDMLWLRSQGFLVTGVEISPIAVHDFFAENGLEPIVTRQGAFERWECDGLVILQGDFFHLTTADIAACAGVFDRASLIALPPEMRVSYSMHFMDILPPRVPVLLITLEYDQQEMKGPPFSVHETEVRGFYEHHYTIERLLVLNALDDEPGFRQRGLTRLDEKVYVLTPR